MKNMKHRLILLFFLLNSLILYGEIRDDEGLISQEELPKIEKEIEKIHDTKKIRIIVNTLEYGEGFVVENPVKTIIVNVGKNENGSMRIESNFSRDLNMEDHEEELNALSDNLSVFIEKGEVGKYLEEYIGEINKILSRNQLENTETFFNMLYDRRWTIIKILALILTIINILVRIKHVSKIKQERYELKLAKEKARREEMKILNEKRKKQEK